MNNQRRKPNDHIKLLEEQVAYLTKERQILLGAMETAGNLSNFQVSVNKMDDPLADSQNNRIQGANVHPL